MPGAKQFQQWEVDYIADSYPQISVAEIAKRLGRTPRGVRNVVNRNKLKKVEVDEPLTVPMDETADPDESLVRLKELRDIQHRALMTADPRNIPALSAEYRATLEEIRAIEEGDKRTESNPLSQIIESINVNLR